MRSFSGQLLDEARELFIDGKYSEVEPLLRQPTLQNLQNPEVFQMLATIHYHRGEFSLAIKTFKKALQIDPTYTDAAVGASIILNDLGKYDEAKKIFEEAQRHLDQKKHKKQTEVSNQIEERIAQKHRELGDLYLQIKRFQPALGQYQMAYQITRRKEDIGLQIAECHIQSGNIQAALQYLKSQIQLFPKSIPTRLKLGLTLYNQQLVAEAVEQWENVLRLDPRNEEANRYLKMAQATGITNLSL